MLAKQLSTWVVSLALIVFSTATIAKETLNARQIMDKVHDVDTGDNAVSNVTMTVVDDRGNTRVLELVSYRKKFGATHKESRSMMFYTSPKELVGVGFLSIQFDDESQPDQRYMYTPSLRKQKKIGSKDNRLSFMASDFSYADMSLRNTHHYDYKLVKEDVLNAQKVWVIEGVPNNKNEVDDNGYARSVFYVRQDNFLAVRIINTMQQGGKEKQLDVSSIEQVDGVWVLAEITMVTRKSGQEFSHTIMKTTNMKFNQPLQESFFTPQQLELGQSAVAP